MVESELSISISIKISLDDETRQLIESWTRAVISEGTPVPMQPTSPVVLPEVLPEIMSVEQAAKYLSVSRATAYNWCIAGDMPSFKIGNTRRIRKADLIALINNGSIEGSDGDVSKN